MSTAGPPKTAGQRAATGGSAPGEANEAASAGVPMSAVP
jgi:hypothetical protein